MSVGHFISHVGTHNASKTCWRAGCNKTAHLERNARFYCGDHYEPNRAEATDAHVRAAHRLMKPTGGGLSLSDAAGLLGLRTNDLDRALWSYIGRAK